jgi:LPXTG-motif cell wall-anchored protein
VEKEESNQAITVAVIGGILVMAALVWTFYRKKEAEDNEGAEVEPETDGEEEEDY